MTIRKAAELTAKIDSIGAELKFWREQSAAKKRWEKHHSQISRVATQVEIAAAKLSAGLKAAVDGGTVLEKARELEELVIDLHAVWEFFRAKLVLRGIDELASHLVVADEFAWSLYRPVLERVDPLHREPPLTFFQADTIPSASPRNYAYNSAGSERLRNEDAIEMLKALPIPVIAVPWYQSRHLPDVLMVAHETGHHVEDLGLTDDLLAAMDGMPHYQSWESWSGEVFADVFATLTCGPAYTTALMDFLTTSPATIASEWTTDGDYPTAYLRMLVSVAALKQCGFAAEAERLEKVWREMFPSHAMADYEIDCPAVAKAILDRSYLGFTLPDLLAFSTDNQQHAVSAATQALDAQTVTAAPDIRELAAAAALAFAKDPVRFHKKAGDKTPQDRVLEQIAKIRTSGTRSGARDDGPRFAADAKARDEAAGADLFEALRRLAAG